MKRIDMELLAPAGERAALEAALEAGANAVYLGLTTLNARRRARNFTQDELPDAVALAHARNARVYVTLNIDLAQREIGQAARMLEVARRAKVDAVLVRDPALLILKRFYPELEFHFSTQAACTSSADVAAAAELGLKRVVLAREMSLNEIAAASAVPGIQTEVFAQGALCFCISGRCLLSSWIGGRSGNRGGCTSPCRVPYSVDGRPAGTPLSMHDLATVDRLAELKSAGVAALKIEGRLKTAQWVGRAVSLYRRGLEGEDPAALLEEAKSLGNYTGRQLTSAYLDGDRDDLTGTSARPAATGRPADLPAATLDDDEDESADEPSCTYALALDVTDAGILARCACMGRTEQWTLPRTVVRREHKATPIGQFLQGLKGSPIGGCTLAEATTNSPDFLLVPRAVNGLVDRIGTALRLAKKAPDEATIHIDLPADVREATEPAAPNAANDLALGEQPDRLRLEPSAIKSVLRYGHPSAIIVEGLTAGRVDKALGSCGTTPMIVALPPVFFEEDIHAMRDLVRECATLGLTVEVNSWGGWRLAREAQVRMEAGPGMSVLNALAAKALGECGIDAVTLSLEADRRQMEDVAAHCPLPCSLVVFGRPALMHTRVDLGKDRFHERTLADRRGVRVMTRLERNVWTVRPADPFDLRQVHNPRLRVAHLVVDLVASPDPARELTTAPPAGTRLGRFNYSRTLA